MLDVVPGYMDWKVCPKDPVDIYCRDEKILLHHTKSNITAIYGCFTTDHSSSMCHFVFMPKFVFVVLAHTI